MDPSKVLTGRGAVGTLSSRGVPSCTSDWLEGGGGKGPVLIGVPGCPGDRRGDNRSHGGAHWCCLQEPGGAE